MSNNQSHITIREANGGDASALEHLAQLDSGRVPGQPMLLAFEHGELQAALATADGATLANPFRPTAELVAMLRIHAGIPAERRGSRAESIRRLGRRPAGPTPSAPSVPGFPAVPSHTH
jgi:hypothetical protein